MKSLRFVSRTSSSCVVLTTVVLQQRITHFPQDILPCEVQNVVAPRGDFFSVREQWGGLWSLQVGAARPRHEQACRAFASKATGAANQTYYLCSYHRQAHVSVV